MTVYHPIPTADLCDADPKIAVCEPIFRDFGGKPAFAGPIRTLKIFEDNALVRATLEQPGNHHVLVIDGGGSKRCALVGGNLGKLAVENHWEGIVVFGCVRDSVELRSHAVGIRALASIPRKSIKGLHAGAIDQVVTFAGAQFIPGHILYADEDGIVVTPTAPT